MTQKFKNFVSKDYTKKETCDATPFFFKKIDRIISKGGKYNIQQRKNGGGKSFNTVNLFGWSWSYFYCFFIFIYVASFVFFSLLYYSVIVRWAHVAANENPEDPYRRTPTLQNLALSMLKATPTVFSSVWTLKQQLVLVSEFPKIIARKLSC